MGHIILACKLPLKVSAIVWRMSTVWNPSWLFPGEFKQEERMNSKAEHVKVTWFQIAPLASLRICPPLLTEDYCFPVTTFLLWSPLPGVFIWETCQWTFMVDSSALWFDGYKQEDWMTELGTRHRGTRKPQLVPLKIRTTVWWLSRWRDLLSSLTVWSVVST